jgi:hypothetical protein
MEFIGTHNVDCKIKFFHIMIIRKTEHQFAAHGYMAYCKYNLTIISNLQLNKINTTDLIQQNATAYGFATNTRTEVLIFQKDSKKRTI